MSANQASPSRFPASLTLALILSIQGATWAAEPPGTMPVWWERHQPAPPVVHVSDWTLSGILPCPDGRLAALPSDALTAPAVGAALDANDFVNVRTRFAADESAVIARATLTVDRSGPVLLLIQSDDACRYLIDGKVVIDHPWMGSISSNRLRTVVELAAGRHEMVMVVTNQRYGWLFRVIACDGTTGGIEREVRGLHSRDGGFDLAAHRRLGLLLRALPWDEETHRLALYHLGCAANAANAHGVDADLYRSVREAWVTHLRTGSDAIQLAELAFLLRTNSSLKTRSHDLVHRYLTLLDLVKDDARWLDEHQRLKAILSGSHAQKWQLKRARLMSVAKNTKAAIEACGQAIAAEPLPSGEIDEIIQLLAVSLAEDNRPAEAASALMVAAAFAAQSRGIEALADTSEQVLASDEDPLPALEWFATWRARSAGGLEPLGSLVPLPIPPPAADRSAEWLVFHFLRSGRAIEAKDLLAAASDAAKRAYAAMLGGPEAVINSEAVAVLDRRREHLMQQLESANSTRAQAVCRQILVDLPGSPAATHAKGLLTATGTLGTVNQEALAWHNLRLLTAAEEVAVAAADYLAAHPHNARATEVELMAVKAGFSTRATDALARATALAARSEVSADIRARALLLIALDRGLADDRVGAAAALDQVRVLMPTGPLAERARTLATRLGLPPQP